MFLCCPSDSRVCHICNSCLVQNGTTLSSSWVREEHALYPNIPNVLGIMRYFETDQSHVKAKLIGGSRVGSSADDTYKQKGSKLGTVHQRQETSFKSLLL